MDTNNWRPTMDSGDWRTTLQPDLRQIIVNKIIETLKRHLPFSVQVGLNELGKIALRFEEKIFTSASSQSDYLRRISLKMLTMEVKSQNTMPNTGNNNETPSPAVSSNMASAGLHSGIPSVSALSQNPISNVVGQNSNMQNI